MYVVDANVISAFAPGRVTAAHVRQWMDAHTDDLYLTATTIAEIEAGIAKSVREGATRKASDLRAWIEAILHLYGDRVLAFDSDAARIAGPMSDRARALGHSAGFADLTIAATARARGYTVLTQNIRDFLPLGVPTLDPFTMPLRG